ncbi:MAG: CFI-box-CTERM domain-containing protein, partial [Syntrophales bacterium]|nr:CFI-box-CTERM domain-containing protein [Syntrophales bacterium]
YGRAVPVFRCPNCGHVGSAGQGGGGITPMMDLPKKDDDSQIRVIFNQSYRCCANCGYQNIIPAGEIYLCKCPNCLTKLNANALGRTQCTPCGHIFDLKEKKGCFIATAAYGTPLSEDVLLLRKLRDDWLINKCWGRIFVQVYYQISPFFADFIKQRPLYQSFVRKLLRPLIWFLKRTYKK